MYIILAMRYIWVGTLQTSEERMLLSQLYLMSLRGIDKDSSASTGNKVKRTVLLLQKGAPERLVGVLTPPAHKNHHCSGRLQTLSRWTGRSNSLLPPPSLSSSSSPSWRKLTGRLSANWKRELQNPNFSTRKRVQSDSLKLNDNSWLAHLVRHYMKISLRTLFSSCGVFN